MFRTLQQLILTAPFALFSTEASAMFTQPDWFDPTNPIVGTNRYAYSHNDPVNITDPNGNCTNDAACEGEWDDPTKTADDIQNEDAVAYASIYDGRSTYALDPKELGFDGFLDIGTTLQGYISGGSNAYIESDLKRALDEAIATGKPVEFSVSALTISLSILEKGFTDAGQIYGDFRVDINGNISADGYGNYSINDATAEIFQGENYDFKIDNDKRKITNYFIDAAGRRPNMNGPNINRVQSRTRNDPRFDSTYGQANIVTESNRTYSFSVREQC